MKPIILDGKKVSEKIKTELKSEILKLKENGITPGLTVILVGDNAASQVYVKNKKKSCLALGISSNIIHLPKDTSEEKLLSVIEKLNQDKKIHGILVQLPLPDHIDTQKIIECIDPKKDVDCFHPKNIGRMFLGNPIFLPCTPSGIIELLKRYHVELIGANVVIIGKSNIVGKPLSTMLINESATVTICHSKTKNLKEFSQKADILVVAAGKIGLITKDMVKQNAVVVDVGINRTEDGNLKGDIDFEEVSKIAKAITPVPGGVGPMTIAMLMRNTVKAATLLCIN